MNIGMEECARLVAGYFRDLARAQQVEVVETDGYPIVFGKYDAGAEKTLIVYFMYDTQPVVDEDWTVDPFAGELVDYPDRGLCLVARGAINTKGPMMAFLNACDAILQTSGRLPVNLLLVAEGEEEMGSRSLGPFLRDRRSGLAEADAVFMPLPAVDDRGVVKIFFGVKGICYFELECSGELWGRGPRLFDIHSSSKAIVDSPAWRLVTALSTMVSEDGNRSMVKGFYDEVKGPSETDRRLIARLKDRFSPSQMQIEINGVDRWIDDLQDSEALLERYLCQPTLNIDGIWGGYTHEGTKTVLPHRVTCKIDIRLVPNMDPERTLRRIRDHLDEHGYADIAIRPLQIVRWARADPDSDIARALITTLEGSGSEVLVFPNAPGTGPWHLFTQDPLSLPCAIGGLGHGGRAHSPDEYFVIEGRNGMSDYRACEKSYVDFLYTWAGEATA